MVPGGGMTDVMRALRRLGSRGEVRVISGGQTGADQGGLAAAEALGLRTGGFAPKGWRTEAGRTSSLGTRYGLTQHVSSAYPPRTEANVKAADLTVVYDESGGKSPGSKLTIRLCRGHGKLFLVNPPVEELAIVLRLADLRVVNIAGNRESSHPGIGERVKKHLMAAWLLT